MWARTLAALGRPIHSRDLSATARRLVADGHARWLSDPAAPPDAARKSREIDDLADVVARIRSLVDTGSARAGSESRV